MRGMPYTQASGKSDGKPAPGNHVAEALAQQAARQPKKTPPNLMPVTPTLPRVPKPIRRRRGR